METAEKKEQYIYAPSRIYSQSRAATAEALPEEQPLRRSRPAERPEAPGRAPQTQTRKRTRDVSAVEARQEAVRQLLKRVLSVVSVFAAAAVIIGVLVRYATISREYSELNELKANITLAEQRIAELNVQLNSAINLDDARATAQNAGLGYPTAEQIVGVKGETDSGTGGALTKPQE